MLCNGISYDETAIPPYVAVMQLLTQVVAFQDTPFLQFSVSLTQVRRLAMCGFKSTLRSSRILKDARIKKKHSQHELSELTGIPQTRITRRKGVSILRVNCLI